ncbi:MAG TPA: hypothetical protein P5060_04235 [Candidatus Absconditabacterales bacterium]|nr:hypothetical protein [Candidatus Absconditabacterales bacterium]
MSKEFLKPREEHIAGLENRKYQKNWEKYSKRYGKNKLLEAFSCANEELSSGAKDFKGTFNMNIKKKLLDDKGNIYMTPNVYKSLMGLFSKFHYFLKQYENDIGANNSVDLSSAKEVQHDVKQNIAENNDYFLYLCNRFGNNFFHILDTYVKQSFDPFYPSTLYELIDKGIDIFGDKLGVDVSEYDRECLKRFVQGRYDIVDDTVVIIDTK